MRVLFFISVLKHGQGGHYHSLNHIARVFAEKSDVQIITLGLGRSEIIELNPCFSMHINFNGFNFLRFRKKIQRELKIVNPDVCHCFDLRAYNLLRLAISPKREKIILNKCGGPNPKSFPSVNNLILFSRENLKWFEKSKKFKDTNIYLIPNRVREGELNANKVLLKKDDTKFTFIRICRIGDVYKKSIEDSINLISVLLESNINNIQLYIIGSIEDEEFYNYIIKNDLVQRKYVVFLTEKKYTVEASIMLYLADAVIGTGRGVMEATSLKRPVLVIDKNGNIPVLLNRNSFESAFDTNFSERNSFSNLTDNLENIISLIKDCDNYITLSNFSYECFNKYFNVKNVISEYTKVYKLANTDESNLFLDFVFIQKTILNFIKIYVTIKVIKYVRKFL